MLTRHWKLWKAGEGRYHVQVYVAGETPQTIPGLILGGNGRWVVQLGNQQWPDVYKSRNKAAAAIVSHHFGLS